MSNSPASPAPAGKAETDRREQRKQSEIRRVPVGALVRVRGMPGFGTGVVREHLTEHRFTDGRVIPYIGFVEARVYFSDDFGGITETLKTDELFVVEA